MFRSCWLAVAVLLALAVTTSATAPALLLHEGHQQDKRTVKADAHLLEEAMRLLAAEGARVAPESVWAAKDSGGEPLERKPSSAVATQGDDQSSSDGSNGSGEHGKEEGSNKEGEKQAKSCLTKEECHKKKLICGKGCTLSAHSKCAAKCSKSCVPTC